MQVQAKHEVILSVGVFNTPQLLWPFDIGDKDVLNKLGIRALVHMLSVGRNISEHTKSSNSWQVNSNNTYLGYLQPPRVVDEVANWDQFCLGLLSISVANQFGWKCLPSDGTIFKKFADHSSVIAQHYAYYSNQDD
jgi:hypothetical protein